MTTLRAFHGSKAIKEKYLDRIRAHMQADELVRGTGFRNGRGCAVGCTLNAYDHSLYPIELGIPEWLAFVEDTLFEKMSLEKSKTWPERFLESIPPGSNLEQVKVPFLVMVMEHSLKSVDSVQYDAIKFPDVAKSIVIVKKAVNQMIAAQKSQNQSEIGVAAESAWLARLAAESAWSAAESARLARAAAESAWLARAAAESAWLARSTAESARSTAESAACDYYADQLLVLLRNCRE